MHIQQRLWSSTEGWKEVERGGEEAISQSSYELVFAFGAREELETSERFHEIRDFYPNARIITCSTAGEILGENVYDNTIVVTAIKFEKSKFSITSTNISGFHESDSAGMALVKSISRESLVHLMVISDGQHVNGSELINGISRGLMGAAPITGGLAGDSDRFQKTLVGLDAPPAEGNIVAISFYGESLRVGYGSIGGWDSFGPDRIVTRSQKNVLYELDGQSALGLYKQYLGELADELPGSALRFPLSIRDSEMGESVVRTILSIDDEEESMIFAGDVPQGAYARLMKANFDRLIDGASTAADLSYETLGSVQPELALLVSCVGRKLVLAGRAEEEVEAVGQRLGEGTAITGFYSYGEISPLIDSPRCELHNQTMTITTFSER
ncbi:MAG: FIST signal transduction protein [Candidatus Kapaibacterium sp.]